MSSGALLACLAACGGEPAEPVDEEPWPRTAACEGLDEWPVEWAELERDALRHIEALRHEGADCGPRGKWGPAAPLRRRTALDCAARSHALDMASEGEVSRLDGEGAGEHARAEAAGYSASVLVQHLAAGPRDGAMLIEDTWLPRPVPCESLVTSELSELGLGHVGDVDDELGTYWVLLLARPEPDSD